MSVNGVIIWRMPPLVHSILLIEATASIVGIVLTGLVITGRPCVTDTTYEVYVVQRVAFSMFSITGSR